MQMNQIKERFSQVEQCIDNAAQTCLLSADAPSQLRNYLNDLEHESDHIKQMVERGGDDTTIQECINKMEKIGDRAMQVCSQGDYVDDQLKNAVRQARKAISTLKQKSH